MATVNAVNESTRLMEYYLAKGPDNEFEIAVAELEIAVNDLKTVSNEVI